ncbi:MAG: hypothetical protein ACRDPH_12270 [Marmoricola sp.]
MRLPKLQGRRRLVVPGVLVAGLLVLTGCSQDPSTAAQVGSGTISTQDVDLMSQALCVAHGEARKQQQGLTPIPVSVVHEQALQDLINTRLDQMLAKRQHIPANNAGVTQQLQRLNPLFRKLPAADRARTRVLLGNLLRGEGQIQQFGAAYLQSAGQRPNAQSAMKAGQAQRSAFAKQVDVTLNPRYDVQGVGHTTNAQSLSKPVSSFAKGATAATPNPQWAAQLPSNQKCG